MMRFHGEKNRYCERHDESHQRRYWVSYSSLPDGSVRCYHGVPIWSLIEHEEMIHCRGKRNAANEQNR